MDKLIALLRSSKLGCSIGNLYFGIMVYADDIILLSPSRMGLQAMMDICQEFALAHNLKFSTNIDPVKSKSKCIHFSKKKLDLAKIVLNGQHLPWVDSALHVGNILERNNSFSKDIMKKRGSFIGRVHSILQEFHFANPVVKMEMISMYATSFYGSSLWNLFNGQCDRLYSAWNNAVRDTFGIPRAAHRYFVEYLSDHLHPMVMLSSRFLKFHQSLQKCMKPSIRFLSQLCRLDHRTSYCQNLDGIAENVNTDLKDLSCSKVKNMMKYCKVPEEDRWRTALVQDLLELRWNSLEIEVIRNEIEDLDTLIEDVCLM